MKEFIHLFTPVSEGYPIVYEKGDWDGLRSDVLIVMDKSGVIYSARMYEYIHRGDKIIEFYNLNDYVIDVTHVLDLSRLTTKEKALDLAKLALDESMVLSKTWKGNFIEKNKRNL